MYRGALDSRLNIRGLLDCLRFKRDFAREHPDFFEPCGTCIFCGAQGYGKTLSAVDYVNRVLNDFPLAVLVTNVRLRTRPYNAFLLPPVGKTGSWKVISMDDGEEVTSESILSGQHKAVTIEYWGLDTLKYVNNGEYGVVFFIDELHLELNSLESKNIDISVMVEISQQRKQRKHIVGTSQIFMRLAKPLREQIKDIVLCQNYFNFFQFNKVIDGETSTESNGKLHADVKKRWFFFHTPDLYQEYDTFAKMKRYNNEWQGVPPVNPLQGGFFKDESRDS